jgi:hypothetical protein
VLFGLGFVLQFFEFLHRQHYHRRFGSTYYYTHSFFYCLVDDFTCVVAQVCGRDLLGCVEFHAYSLLNVHLNVNLKKKENFQKCCH